MLAAGWQGPPFSRGFHSNSLMTDIDDNREEFPENLGLVGSYPGVSDAQEHALVILAMKQSCWVIPGDAGFDLMADATALEGIRAEIAAYENERPSPAPAPSPEEIPFRFPAGRLALALWIVALVASFSWQSQHPGWTDFGASSSTGLIDHHEWWRPFTSLFLHADTPHLVGNLVAGTFFGTLVARSIGAARGWPMILACGTLGNTLTSLVVWPDPFVSIGASTAVFGALGILSGIGFSSLVRHHVKLSPARTAAPVIGGIIVLGLMGGGAPDGNTDVLGHVLGFASGLACGFLHATFSRAAADASSGGIARAARDGPT